MTPLLVVPRLSMAIPAWQPPPPRRSPTCSHPTCGRTALHRHHTVARSQQRSILGIRDALDWLEIDGELVCVVVDFCAEHHDDLESNVGGCRSRLRWAGGWAWYDRQEEVSMPTGPIIWFDRDNLTYWKLRGFCKGEYRAISHIG